MCFAFRKQPEAPLTPETTRTALAAQINALPAEAFARVWAAVEAIQKICERAAGEWRIAIDVVLNEDALGLQKAEQVRKMLTAQMRDQACADSKDLETLRASHAYLEAVNTKLHKQLARTKKKASK